MLERMTIVMKMNDDGMLTMVIKYLVNLNGMSLTGYLKMSTIT